MRQHGTKRLNTRGRRSRKKDARQKRERTSRGKEECEQEPQAQFSDKEIRERAKGRKKEKSEAAPPKMAQDALTQHVQRWPNLGPRWAQHCYNVAPTSIEPILA